MTVLKPFFSSLPSAWQQLAYRNLSAEFLLYVLSISGLLLWSVLEVPWAWQRWSLSLHSLAGALCFPLLVLPFWLSHRRLLAHSDKVFLRRSGRLLELLLLLLTLSGYWLFFVGNRGNPVDAWISLSHLTAGLLLTPLLLRHAWRWSLLRRATLLLLTLLPLSAQGASSSSSLISDSQQHWLYSANAEAGSLSRINLHDPSQRQEISLGRDIRQLALAESANLLAASGYLDDQLWLLDANSLQLRQTIALGQRPYGVLFDPAQQWFWLTLMESHELVAVDLEGNIRHRVQTAESPRGLALLSDGRLLVSHALSGQVSVYASRDPALSVLQVLNLVTEQHPDEFVSQGLPRLLDFIGVSPDETEIWLPHVLWNFDHPFQFQSTVFPAISILKVSAGEITEAPNERKQLFKQINLHNANGRSQIVSNPAQVLFHPSGSKAYVSFAGSEDLLVFDRQRSASHGQNKSERRQGKLAQGGAQASQLLRHLPGAQPQALLWRQDGLQLLIQNLQSLDLSLLDSGGDNAFARPRVLEPSWARLSLADALSPNQRLGATLFQQANSQRQPQTPMTGDFWMSCQSCHLDGFNFSNRYLMEANSQDKQQQASTGHPRLHHLLSGDLSADLIKLIQDTQGGLGADQRDGALHTDALAPASEVRQQMQALQDYIRLPHNLPFGPSWLRLSQADGPQLRPQDWPSSASCASCHEDIFKQWADSNHRLMAESNPYYRVLEDLAGQSEGEGFRAWCVGCHNPQRSTVRLPFRGQSNLMFEQGAASLLADFQQQNWALDEGPGCVFCHRIDRLEDSGGNAGYRLSIKERPLYPGEDSPKAWLRWLAQRTINASPQVHAESYSQPFYQESAYCRGCHDEFSPGHGARIVTTFDEWAQSSFNQPDKPEQNRSCIDCHMHADIAQIGTPIPGYSTAGGKLKNNVVTHQFSGANHHLVGLRNPEQEAMSLALLRSSATLEQRWQDGQLVVRVRNVGAGHALPTGVADFRQFWLEVKVTDAQGQLLLHSGKADAQGHLAPDARLFMKVFGDANGQPVGLKFWRFERLLSDTRIPADGYRDEAFSLPPHLQWPLQVETRLNFRIYPQWVTDAVQQQVPELPTPPIVQLVSLQQRWHSPTHAGVILDE